MTDEDFHDRVLTSLSDLKVEQTGTTVWNTPARIVL
jgi:hypothetical protein